MKINIMIMKNYWIINKKIKKIFRKNYYNNNKLYYLFDFKFAFYTYIYNYFFIKYINLLLNFYLFI
jgi:hypothetical protein